MLSTWYWRPTAYTRRKRLSGTAGFWTNSPRDARELSIFTDMLAGRGPAGRGLLLADNRRIGLGHRRLEPLTTGIVSDQPMVSADKRYACPAPRERNHWKSPDWTF